MAVGSGIALALSTLLWTAFLSLSGFSFVQLIQFNELGNVFKVFSSMAFWGFVATLPVSYAIAALMARHLQISQAYALAVLGSVIGLGLAWIAFPSLRGFSLAGVFYVLSMLATVYLTHMRIPELKKWVILRSSSAGIKGGLQVLGVGVFIALAGTALTVNVDLVQEIQDLAFKGSIGNIQLEEVAADLFIGTQKDQLAQLTSFPTYQALLSKQDPEVQAFVLTMDQIQQNIDSPAYKASVVSQLQANKALANTQSNVEQLVNQLPLIQTLGKYYWILVSFIGISIYFLFASLLFRPLGVGYAVLLGKLLAGAEPKE
ncbi:MAG: hypothetical protein HY393_01210 [Candidatus Diapherotrites archaeon]|nr:hypothetical protein [Candidatus Diapherotrites archaeon]